MGRLVCGLNNRLALEIDSSVGINLWALRHTFEHLRHYWVVVCIHFDLVG